MVYMVRLVQLDGGLVSGNAHTSRESRFPVSHLN